MIYRKFLPVLILLTVFSGTVFSQQIVFSKKVDTIGLPTIINRTVKYVNAFPAEKVYVGFDKPYYAAGDTIWLKAYVTVDLHIPTVLSKIVYVDLYNDQDSLTASLKLPLVNGMAPGMIPLPVQGYRQGNYRLRAYTSWMLNFDPAYMFNKIVTIGNPVENEVLTTVNYTTNQGAQPTVTARIFYKDAQGKPYADKKVNWRVESSHDEVVKGKGNTDANGYLTVNLPPIPSITLSSGMLITDMDMGNRKQTTNTFALKTAAPGKDVQFFPEGGLLIAGLSTNMAVKAIKADGLGIDAKGTVTDNDGKTVGNFTTTHLGMGVFSMQAEVGKNYKANVTFADGSQGTYDLPRVQSSGISISVTNTDPENLNIKIIANDAYFQANKGKNFYIIAQTSGFIKYAAQTPLDKQEYNASIPKSKFQTGILQLTLMAATGTPLSERLVFIRRDDLLHLNITTDKKLYSRRQAVKLVVNAKNGAAADEANLAVSVIDESKIPVNEDAETTILSNLLLTSDLKGYIEQPNYYFNHNDDKTAASLDALMLTQGYRRFSYRDILGGRYPQLSFMPEQSIEITGTLRNRTGLPIFKGNVRLLIPDKNVSMQTTTNADGQFKFENVVINDSTKVVINARDNVNSNSLMLMVDGAKYPAVTRNINLPDEKMNIDSTMRPYLDNSKRLYNSTHQLKEVVIKAAPAPKRLGHLDQASLAGLNPDPDHVLDGDRFKGCTDFVSCLQAMALGLTYVDNNFYVTRDYNGGNRSPMEVYADGLQVDMNYLLGVNPAEVESVEIFFKDGVSGINRRDNTNGVLVINKKKVPKSNMKLADLQKLIPPPYIVEFTPHGYAVTKDFYSPKYIPNKPSGVGIDLRTTIYWNPKVLTDKVTGNAVLQYYNADGQGSYRAVVEGIDKDGNIGHYVYRYQVQ